MASHEDKPYFYPHRVESVRLCETHISMVMKNVNSEKILFPCDLTENAAKIIVKAGGRFPIPNRFFGFPVVTAALWAGGALS